MQHKRNLQLISRDLKALLAPLSSTADLYNIIRKSVGMVEYGLGGKRASNKPWLLLPLIVCESIIGSYEYAIPAAVALHLMNSAAEVFDDTEDVDSAQALSARYNPAVAVNTGTTLLILAETAITRLRAKGVEDGVIIRVMEAINSYYTTACIGQHLDLTLAPEAANSEDIYFKIAGMKSASTIECACHIGALLAKASQELVNTFSQLGYNLGIASQIANDIEGITGRRDIRTNKITLPVIYALNHITGTPYDYLKSAFVTQGDPLKNIQKVIDTLFDSGAIQYSVVQMELYKQKARDILKEIERNEVNIEQLREFLI